MTDKESKDNFNLNNSIDNKNTIIDIKEFKLAKEKELLRKLAIEDKNLENQYDCCFGKTTDARVLTFLSKFLIIFSTLVFSFIMILTLDNSSEKQVFIVIVNTILAVFLPSPSIKKGKKDNS